MRSCRSRQARVRLRRRLEDHPQGAAPRRLLDRRAGASGEVDCLAGRRGAEDDDAAKQLLRSLAEAPHGAEGNAGGRRWSLVSRQCSVSPRRRSRWRARMLRSSTRRARSALHQTRGSALTGPSGRQCSSAEDGVGYSTVFLTRQRRRTAARPVQRHSQAWETTFYSARRAAGRHRQLAASCDGTRMLPGEGNRWVCVRDGKDESPGARQRQRARGTRAGLRCRRVAPRLGSLDLTTRVTLADFSSALDDRDRAGLPRTHRDRRLLRRPHQAAPRLARRQQRRDHISVGRVPEHRAPRQVVPRLSRADACRQAGGLTFCLTAPQSAGWTRWHAALRRRVGTQRRPLPQPPGTSQGIMGPLDWFKPMDLRLRGKHAVRYSSGRTPAPPSEDELVSFARTG